MNIEHEETESFETARLKAESLFETNNSDDFLFGYDGELYRFTLMKTKHKLKNICNVIPTLIKVNERNPSGLNYDEYIFRIYNPKSTKIIESVFLANDIRKLSNFKIKLLSCVQGGLFHGNIDDLNKFIGDSIENISTNA